MNDHNPGAHEPAHTAVPAEAEVVPPEPEAEGDLDLGGVDIGGIDLAALLGGESGGLSGILEMAQQLQAGMVDAQAQAAAQKVEGVSGGGAVRIEATAGLEFTAVHIRPDAVDPTDVEMLEDLVLAALRDTVVRANEVQAEALGGLSGFLPDEG